MTDVPDFGWAEPHPHSPTPWHAEFGPHYNELKAIFDSNNEKVLSPILDDGDAGINAWRVDCELIVHAVNCHAKLVSALKLASKIDTEYMAPETICEIQAEIQKTLELVTELENR